MIEKLEIFHQRSRLILAELSASLARAFRNDESKLAQASQIVALEDRVLLSASPLGVIDAGAVESTEDAVSQTTSTEIVFIDSAADVDSEPQLKELLSKDNPDLVIVQLDADRDGVEQITEYLSGKTNIDAIHIVSHGVEGGFQLGNTWLNNESLEDYANSLVSWRDSFAAEGDFLIYGCDLASSESGRELVEGLSALSGADVAASDDLTGHSSLGGDWDLEYQYGQVETGIVFSETVQQEWIGRLATFTVNSTLDDGSAGTLRWAIDQANLDAVADTIVFDLGSGVKKISPLSPMTPIINPLLIDGWTMQDFVDAPLLEIKADGFASGDAFTINADNVEIRGLIVNRLNSGDAFVVNGDNNLIRGNYIGTNQNGVGSGIGNVGNGITITGANNTIGGTGVNDMNVIADNTGHGIFINGINADGNTILGNYIGVDISGDTGLGNDGDGIHINAGDLNILGGNTAAARNVISGNGNDGILLTGGANQNTILGNYIGTNQDGTTAIGNGFAGIEIIDSDSNTIGGTSSNDRNVISGNDDDGIAIRGSASFDNAVQGNYIGISADGLSAVGNVFNGVWITQGAHDNIIGGSVAGAGNVISGNEDDGVEIQGATTTANYVLGNYVGLDPTGLFALANGDGTNVDYDAGIVIEDSPGNFIGGVLVAERNYIAGNSGSGIIIGATGSVGNVLYNNYIGVLADGTTPLGNTRYGILVTDDIETSPLGNPTGTIIGGIAANQGNLIANNSLDGVRIVAGDQHTIRRNQFLNNGELAIDLAADGVTGNDPGDGDGGANQQMNFADLGTAYTNFSEVDVTGSLDTGVALTNFDLDFYWSVADDGSFHGEAENYIDSATVTTDGTGVANFSVTINGNVPAGARLTAVATDGAGNSSEFSLNIGVQEVLNIDLPAPQLNWDVGDGIVLIDPGAILNNPQSVAWDTGELTVSFPVGGTTFDQLSIFAPATVGNIGIQSGTNVRYHGGGSPDYFGDIISDGSNGTDLVIRFNATATDVMVQRLLQSIQFENTEPSPVDSVRTVEFVLTDTGGNASNFETELIRVGPANDPPSVGLAGGFVTYDEDAVPIIIDGALTVTDSDSPNLEGATVQITTAFVAGQDLLTWNDTVATSRGISVSYDAATGILTLTGSQSALDYQDVLQTVGYQNSSDDPDTTNRVVTFTADDGFDESSDSRQVRITATNDAPIIDLDDNDSVKPGLDFETTYIAGEGSVAVIDTDAVLSDPDNATLDSLTVTITTGFVALQDQLLYDSAQATTWGLTHSYDINTGILSITGTESVANYQFLLDSIRYDNIAADPDASSSRTIEFVANDGSAPSLTAKTELFVSKGLGILLSTETVIGGTGTPDLTGWDDEDIIELADPNLQLEPAGDSDGTVSMFLDMSTKTSKNITAMHFVTRDMTLGSGVNTVDVLYGDVLFVLKNQDTFNGNTAWSMDVVRYRSSDGTFEAIGENLSGDTRPIVALTLVEQDTVVGDITLEAGSFLFVKGNTGGEKNDIWYYKPTALGDSISAGGTWDKLIEGDEIGLNQPIESLDLVESTTTLGGATLQSGWILASVDDAETIGDLGTPINVQPQDIFYLNVSTTTLNGGAPGASAEAVKLLDGYNSGADPNVYFDTIPETITALSLNQSESSPWVPPPPTNSAPTDIAPISFGINENVDTTGGVNLGTLTAADPDTGDTFTYSIIGGADAAAFLIDGASLDELHFDESLIDDGMIDFEDKSSYSVTVRVTDSFGNVYDEALSLNVNDLNEAPVITSDGGGATAALNVLENTTAVTDLDATDEDTPGDTLTYNITGGADQLLFNINTSNGLLTFATARDFETFTDADSDGVYEVQVTVDDGNGLTDVQSISVTITDDNETPTITSDGGGATAAINVAENTTAVTTVTATDPDLPADTLTYTISGGADSGGFAINSSTGVLTLVSGKDFETFTDADLDGVYEVEVTVDDGNGLSDVQSISVTITDENETPTITSDGGGGTAAINVAENTTAVTTVTATDPDLPADTLTYTISGGADSGDFAINASTGALTLITGKDFETFTDANSDGVYEVQVTVDDGNGLTDVQTISVTITDDNEAPVITSAASTSLAENQTTVLTVTSSDEDTPIQPINYTITGGADSGLFTLHPTTGVLTFNTAPDFELPADVGANNVYEVEVTANDGAGGLTTQMITVTVTDISGPLIVDTTNDVVDGNTNSVEELIANKGADGFISLREAIIAANNTLGADTIMLSAGTYSLGLSGSNEDSAALGDLDVLDDLTIDGADAATTIIDANNLDRVFDIWNSITVNIDDVTMTSGDIGNKWGGAMNINDGTVNLTRVIVSGNDGDNGAGLYNYKANLNIVDSTISGNSGKWGGGIYNDGGTTTLNRVTISGNTATSDGAGIYNVGAGAVLNATNITVSGNTASVAGGGVYNKRIASFVSATIAFNSATDGGGFYTATPGTTDLLNSIVASNAGGNLNSTGSINSLGYNIDSANSLGLSNTGDQINADPMLDGLADNGGFTETHALLGGSDAVNTGTSAGTPSIDQRGVARDANRDIGAYELAGGNGAPSITSSLNPNVAENTVFVQSLTAVDPDIDALMFSISGGADGGLFTIVGVNQLEFVAAPDYELPTDTGANNIYEVEITVIDGNGGSDVELISVYVTPVNDNVPVFVSTSTPSIAENQTTVHTLTATDNDLPSQLISFSITGGADAARFSINGANELEYLLPPDFELPTDSDTNNVYEVEITADDGNGGMAVQLINVTVTPVEDNNPLFVSSNIQSVAENQTAVHTLVASDGDFPSQTIGFSITGGADEILFAIDGTDQLIFVSAPDFELPIDTNGDNIYEVEVTASDGNGGSAVQTVFVTITDVNESPTLSLVNVVATLAENANTASSLRIADIVIDDDVVGTNVLTLSGADATSFEVVGNELRLRAGTTLDFETKSSFDVIVSVDDLSLPGVPEDSEGHTLNIADVNEAPFVIGPTIVNSFEDAAPVVIDLTNWFDDVDAADSNLTETIQSVTFVGLNAIIDPVTHQLTLWTDPDKWGTGLLTVRATDGSGLFAEKVVTVNVAPVNDTITVGNQFLSGLAETAVSGNLLPANVDVDGESLSVIITTPSSNGTLVVNLDGSFTFTPNADFNGTTSFSFVLDDGVSPSNVATVEITILDGATLPDKTPSNTETPAEEAQPEADPAVDLAPEMFDTTNEASDNLEPSAVSQVPIEAVVQFVIQPENETVFEVVETPVLFGASRIKTDVAPMSQVFNPYYSSTMISSAMIVMSQPGSLWTELDAFQKLTTSANAFGTITIGSVGTVSSGLIVGYVIYAIRSGLLLSSLIAAMPAWNLLDPLAIISVADGDKNSQGESLEEIVETQKQKMNENIV